MSFKAFVKRYSAVPNAFIDELFDTFDENTPQNVPSLSIVRVSNWMGVSKQGIMKTLKESYVEGIDYTAAKPSNSTDVKVVLLTPECFKRLCMQSRSKKAEDMRTYFIEIESLLLKYNADLVRALQARIEEGSKGSNGSNGSKGGPGFIYVLKASRIVDSVYKIGRTNNLVQRLKDHRAGMIEDVEVMFLYETDDLDEVKACIKGLLKKHRYRKYKEFYQADIDMIKAFTSGCSKLKMNYRKCKPSVMTGGYYIALL